VTSNGAKVPLPGSERKAWPDAHEIEPAAGDATLDVSLWLRPRRGGELDRERALELGATLPARRRYETRAALASGSGADPADAETLRAYLREHRIEAVETSWRSVRARGTLGAFSGAFETKIGQWEMDGLRLRQRTGPLCVPARLTESVRGVFGLDTWPRRAAMRQPKAPDAHRDLPPALTAEALARDYEFPAGDGRGQTIGILHFGATFDPHDFEMSMRSQGRALPKVALARVDGDVPPAGPEADLELAIDTQVSAMLAPGAELVLYGASHDERGILDAIRMALFDEEHRPSILSISYGWPECCWTRNALELLDELFVVAALLGVSVFCASGDHGAEELDGKPHVFAPASSPFVHACGGTQVEPNGKRLERSWPGSGGGFSERSGAAPHWQSAALEKARKAYPQCGRGVPDVAAYAFPPAYPIVTGKRAGLAGGTSAVAPLWSALTARLNQRLGTALGFYAPLLYAKAEEAALFRAVTGEGNAPYSAPEGWTWNPCTGLGVPRGTSLERALRGD
jgi:kumamolisin